MNNLTILNLRNQVCRLKKQIRKYHKGQILLNNKKKCPKFSKKAQVHNLKNARFNSKADIFFQNVVDIKYKMPRKTKYGMETKLLAFGILERSPEAYPYIRNVFQLPCESLLRKKFKPLVNRKIKEITEISSLTSLISQKQKFLLDQQLDEENFPFEEEVNEDEIGNSNEFQFSFVQNESSFFNQQL